MFNKKYLLAQISNIEEQYQKLKFTSVDDVNSKDEVNLC